MLPTFSAYPVISQNQLLSADVETLKLWYTKYPDINEKLNTRLTLLLLSQQHKVLTPTSIFPEFYTQYMIKYHPKESNVASSVIKGIAINNDDPVALLNLLQLSDDNRVVVDQGLLPEDVVRIFKSNKLNLIHTLEIDDRFNAKHMIMGCRGMNYEDYPHISGKLLFDFVKCAVACGYLDQFIKGGVKGIPSVCYGLVIANLSVNDYEKQIDKLVEKGANPRNIIVNSILPICKFDKLDLMIMMKVKFNILNTQIFKACRLSSTKILQFIYDQESELFNDIEFRENSHINPAVGRTSIFSVKWMFEVGLLTSENNGGNVNLLILLCLNEDIESIVYLLDRIELTYYDLEKLKVEIPRFPSNVNYFLSQYGILEDISNNY